MSLNTHVQDERYSRIELKSWKRTNEKYKFISIEFKKFLDSSRFSSSPSFIFLKSQISSQDSIVSKFLESSWIAWNESTWNEMKLSRAVLRMPTRINIVSEQKCVLVFMWTNHTTRLTVYLRLLPEQDYFKVSLLREVRVVGRIFRFLRFHFIIFSQNILNTAIR